MSAVYKILSDESKRSLYDETGEIDEESDGILNDPDRDWVDYWRLLFKVRMIICTWYEILDRQIKLVPYQFSPSVNQ